jgi:hypothetical protein
LLDGAQRHPIIPLEIPLHVEQDELLEDLLQQLRAFLVRIQGCAPTVVIRPEPDTEM